MKMLQKVTILALYASILFLILRSIDWYYSLIGVAIPTVVDPNRLNVRKLKSLLNYRGILHGSAIEKSDLVDIATASGQISNFDMTAADDQAQEDEILDADTKAASANVEMPSNQNKPTITLWESVGTQKFTGAAHFYELVEDSKDSAWLVRVDVEGSFPALSNLLWRKAFSKFGRFGIRFGIFDCATDPED